MPTLLNANAIKPIQSQFFHNVPRPFNRHMAIVPSQQFRTRYRGVGQTSVCIAERIKDRDKPDIFGSRDFAEY